MPAAAVKRVAARIADFRAVDVDLVVVQAGNERRGRDGPEAVGLLLHVDLGPAPEVELHLVCLGRLDPDLHASRVIDARIFGAPDVRLRGPELSALLGATNAGE